VSSIFRRSRGYGFTPKAAAVKRAALSKEAVSPVLCQRELDVADFDTVLSMLGNPVHTPMQQTVIYNEVKKRRALVNNRQ
jgi:hypothetical protein